VCNHNTILELGKFQYNKVPMGVRESPDFAQEVMEDIVCDLKDIEVYKNDIGIFALSKEHTFELQDEVLR
jgi:hypothetical protein